MVSEREGPVGRLDLLGQLIWRFHAESGCINLHKWPREASQGELEDHRPNRGEEDDEIHHVQAS